MIHTRSFMRARRRRRDLRSSNVTQVDEAFLNASAKRIVGRFMREGFLEFARRNRGRAKPIMERMCDSLVPSDREEFAQFLLAEFTGHEFFGKHGKRSRLYDMDPLDEDKLNDSGAYLNRLSDVIKNDGSDILFVLMRDFSGDKNQRWLDFLAAKAFGDDGDSRHDDAEVSPFEHRLNDMCQCLGLNEVERELVLALYIVGVAESLSATEACEDILHAEIFSQQMPIYLGCSRGEVTRALSMDGALRRCDIAQGAYSSRCELNDAIGEYLIGYKGDSFLGAVLQKVDPKDADLADVSVPKPQIDLLLRLLRQDAPSQVILYGLPGHGKTTLALAAAKAAGREIYQIRDPHESDPADIVRGVKLAGFLLRGRSDAVLIIDEADRVLCTDSVWQMFGEKSDKAWLNQALDVAEANYIWITNQIRGIAASTQRRFDLAIKFGALNAKQRFDVWYKILGRMPEAFGGFDDELIWDLATRYPLAPSVVRETAEKVAAMDTGAATLATFKQMLNSAMDLARMTSGGMGPKMFRPAANYSLEGLNINIDPTQMIESVRHVYDYIEANPDERRPTNLNILLAGPPGTGKTELVKYIATETGRDVILKRASDLLSMFVGGTEQAIAGAFAEAEQAGAILFLDEADSLIRDRESAVRSWETSQTNELLQQMENFRGVLICATNNELSFDGAAFRRFAIKAKFDYLRDSAKLLFFKRFFSEVEITPEFAVELEKSLRDMPCLAPGDFHAVANRLRFVPGGLRGVDEIIKSLAAEVEFKARKVGRGIGYRS